MKRRAVAAVGLIVVVAGLGAVGWSAWSRQRAWDQALHEARTDAALGRWDAARARLTKLSHQAPGRGDVAFLLGAAEAAADHVDAALDAWGRVPADAPESTQATLRRARLAVDRGRFAVAEETIRRAPPRLRDETEAIWLELLLISGRVDELRDGLQKLAARKLTPETLRSVWLLDSTEFPAAMVRERLDRARRDAPEDDRVWLGLANLGTLSDQIDEADRWLARCESRRPSDLPVLRARFAWAMAAERPDRAAAAMAQIPEPDRDPDALIRLRARVAADRGDVAVERREWEALLRRDPADGKVLTHLIDLARSAGAGDRLAPLLARKAEVDAALDRYRDLWTRDAVADHPEDAARLAEQLGRSFDARILWQMARRRDVPGSAEALARLDAREKTIPTPDRSLPGPVADKRPAAPKTPESPAARLVPSFRDDAESAGLRFTFHADRTPLCRLPETMSGGVGLIDYDGDGDLDVYAIQGGKLIPDSAAPDPAGGDRLFRNRGDGKFEDVTEAAGLARLPGGYGHGVAVGDVDNDGDADLFLTRWRGYALLRNRGDGTFEDATEAFGLGGDRDWPTSAAFADLDNDGDLDLCVCHYLVWDPATTPTCESPSSPSRHMYCTPRQLPALPDHLFRNDGGRFVDVSAEAGITDRDGRGLGVVAADLDDDGRVDLFVANDMTANALYHNQGNLRFREVAMTAGVGANADGGYQAGMGIACGDLDGDGRIDLAVTNFHGESTTFYRNLGGLQFADRTRAIGLAQPSRWLLGFGATFLDADNDGKLDLATTNGHVNDLRPQIPHEMPCQLLRGTGNGRVADVTARAGPCWSAPRLGRGLARGDLDDDGREDLVIVASDGPLAFFRNTGPTGHWLTLALEGTKSNRDAVGARVTVSAGGRRQVAPRFGGGSYLSASDGRLHFGLGDSTQAETVEIRWPSGRVDQHRDLAADRVYRFREGVDRINP